MKYFFACLCLCLPFSAHAQNIDDVFELTLRPGWRVANGTHIAALQVTLSPGWKTYWRQPGDTGIPPMFDWSGSDNVGDVTVHWPTPKVSWIEGQRSIGYYEQVVFPLTIHPQAIGPIHLNATVHMGICDDICIPVTAHFAATLPDVGARDAAIQRAMATQIPNGAGDVQCHFTPTRDSMTVRLSIPMTGTVPPDVVVEVPVSNAWVAEPQVSSGPSHWVAHTEILTP
ncbi:MAG: protein-disulfide reductase DsbD domain-containing protein, partial [Pseudomonadota bacterium]